MSSLLTKPIVQHHLSRVSPNQLRDFPLDVKSRKQCRADGCGKGPSLGVAGTKTAEYCTEHAPLGVVNVNHRECRAESCGKRASFGVAGTKTAEYCAQHVSDGMVNVYRLQHRPEDCGTIPSFGVADVNISYAYRGCNKHASFIIRRCWDRADRVLCTAHEIIMRCQRIQWERDWPTILREGNHW